MRSLLSILRAGTLTAMICVAEARLAYAAPGDLYEADFASGSIFRISPAGVKSTFAFGLNSPSGIAFDGKGNLFVADYGANAIYKFTAAGLRTTFVASGLSHPYGLAFDSSGNLFLANLATGSVGTILKFTPAGTKATFASSLHSPAGLAFDSLGNLYESDFTGNVINKFSSTGTKTLFASSLLSPDGLAINSADDLFEDDGNGSVHKFTSSGTKTVFTSGLSQPSGVAVAATGEVYVSSNSDGTITKYSSAGGAGTVFATGMANPQYLAFEPALPTLSSVSVSGSGQFQLQGQTVPNRLVTIQGTASLAAGFSDISTTKANSSGVFTWQDTRAGIVPPQFYRAVLP